MDSDVPVRIIFHNQRGRVVPRRLQNLQVAEPGFRAALIQAASQVARLEFADLLGRRRALRGHSDGEVGAPGGGMEAVGAPCRIGRDSEDGVKLAGTCALAFAHSVGGLFVRFDF